MIIKSVYRTHSFQTPFLDWYFKGLSIFIQTPKKGFFLQRFQQHAI